MKTRLSILSPNRLTSGSAEIIHLFIPPRRYSAGGAIEHHYSLDNNQAQDLEVSHEDEMYYQHWDPDIHRTVLWDVQCAFGLDPNTTEVANYLNLPVISAMHVSDY